MSSSSASSSPLECAIVLLGLPLVLVAAVVAFSVTSLTTWEISTTSVRRPSSCPSSYGAGTRHPEENDRARGSDGAPGGPRRIARRLSTSSTRGECIHPPARKCLARESSCTLVSKKFMP